MYRYRGSAVPDRTHNSSSYALRCNGIIYNSYRFEQIILFHDSFKLIYDLFKILSFLEN